MERAHQDHDAERPDGGARHQGTGSNHAASDELAGDLVGVVGRRTKALAELVTRGIDDAKPDHGFADQGAKPCQQRPRIGAERREARAVALGQFARRLTVAKALAPPAAPGVAGPMGHGDVGDVAHEPTSVVESPHEIDVLAVAQRLVEAVAETAPAHHQTGARNEVNHRVRNHQGAAITHVQGAEALLEVVARRSTARPADPWRDRALEGIVEVRLKTPEDVAGIVEDHVDVDEPEQWTRRRPRAGVSRAPRSEIDVQPHDVGTEALRAVRDGVCVARAVIDDRHVQAAQ